MNINRLTKSFSCKKSNDYYTLYTDEEIVDILFCRIIAGLFSDWEHFGPVDSVTDYNIHYKDYESIERTCGIDAFLDRLNDYIYGVVKDLHVFNGKPTTEDRTIVIETTGQEDGPGYPITLTLGAFEGKTGKELDEE